MGDLGSYRGCDCEWVAEFPLAAYLPDLGFGLDRHRRGCGLGPGHEQSTGSAVMTGRAARPRYEIRVRGELTPALVSMLEALNLRTEQTETGPILVGVFRDQAELNGALQALSDLGIELVSVRQLDG